jgi:Na+/H+-translocating membrane pyrophosphatase
MGMRIAVVSNYRTTFKVITDLDAAFKVAYQAEASWASRQSGCLWVSC